jgi:hypothetical protein
MTEPIVIAILAKDKEYCLPLFLQSIYNQTYPKDQIHLYIRTNDNKDATQQILEEWLERVRGEYLSVFYNSESVDSSLKEYKEHQWNTHRFSVLAAIRQDSVNYAKAKGAHYFVADCDNFIVPETLERLYKNRALGVIAPLLESPINYSNYHHCCTQNGYYKDCDEGRIIRYNKVRGLIEVDVAHCAYLIAHQFLNKIVYDDDSGRMEYVIFSHWLRYHKIPQLIDNTIDYGFLVSPYPEDSAKEFKMSVRNHFLSKYKCLFNPTTPAFCEYLLALLNF